MKYNVYCDESCHLEHDSISKMVVGCVWVPKKEVRRVSSSIKDMKIRYGYPWEIKWKRVSPGLLDFYRSLIEYFFGEPHLHFRCLVVSDKSKLDHSTFNAGSHDAFYYKMFYQVLHVIVESEYSYEIYMDIKDTRSARRVRLLKDILRSKFSDADGAIIRRVQHIRSHESAIMQLCDLLIGAVAYRNRGLAGSEAKLAIADLIAERAAQPLDYKSPLNARKFNLFIFEPNEAPGD